MPAAKHQKACHSSEELTMRHPFGRRRGPRRLWHQPDAKVDRWKSHFLKARFPFGEGLDGRIIQIHIEIEAHLFRRVLVVDLEEGRTHTGHFDDVAAVQLIGASEEIERTRRK
jgi:hypothetical protein